MFDVVSVTVGLLLFVIIALMCLLFLFLFMMVRDLRGRAAVPPHMQTDLTNMTILFNTMRDMVTEQKDLARRFNESLDAKVAQVREVMDVSLELGKQLQTMRREVAQLIEQANAIETTSHHAEPPEEAQNSLDDAETGIELAPSPEWEELNARVLDIVVEEKQRDPGDVIDSWTGLDFGDSAGNGYEEDTAPIEPKDAEAARDAFRALLNFDEPASVENPKLQPANVGAADNGLTPLESRVYEYSDAGMKVPEIARELGVGKGEVRLMLSLRKAKES